MKWAGRSLCFALALFAAAKALAQTYTWRPAEVGGGGFVPGIIFHPAEAGLVYAGWSDIVRA